MANKEKIMTYFRPVMQIENRVKGNRDFFFHIFYYSGDV